MSSAASIPSPAKRAVKPMSREPLDLVGPQGAGEQRVVADLGVGVEGEVVGGERDVVQEERAQSPIQGVIDVLGHPLPEQPVMDQDELGVLGGRALEQLDAGGHARDQRSHLLRTGYLKPVGGVVIEVRRMQKSIQIGD